MNINNNNYNPIEPKELEDYTNIKNIVLIDRDVQDYIYFYDYANVETLPITYSSHSNRLDLINFLRLHFTKIDRIGIVCNDASLENKPFINGELFYTQDDLIEGQQNYTENLKFMIDMLNEFQVVHIDYLACKSLNLNSWVKYYDIIGNNTSAIVGASNDDTGNILYGGDWIMETTGEDIELIYWTSQINVYNETLATSTISTSTTVTNANLNNSLIYTWPITINGGSLSTPTVITFGDNITFNSLSQYFIVGSGYITFEGNKKTVTIDGVTSYLGLIRNGTTTGNGNSNIIVRNIGINVANSSTLNTTSGWIGQIYWSNGGSGCSITNCYSTGQITNQKSGGITGQYSFGTLSYCYSTGNMPITAKYSGGICSGGFNGTISNCFSLGSIEQNYCGGIVGGYFASTATISNCYSTGVSNGQNSGGIIGGLTNSSGVTISNCYTSGNITGPYSGGIVGGYTSGNPLIINCYTTGSISGIRSGGICGRDSTIRITNCYTTGIVSGTNANVLIGVGINNATITSSYGSGTGTWSDSTAQTYLTGNPTYSGSTLTNPVGTIWSDINSTNSTTPWIFSSFGYSPYSSSNVTSYSQTITRGSSSIAALSPSGYNFYMIGINSQLSSNFSTISIIQSNATTGGTISATSSTIGNDYTIKIYATNGTFYTMTNVVLKVLFENIITSSFSIYNSYVPYFAWPITLNNSSITLTIADNLTFTSSSQYFIINSSNITFDGNNKTITISSVPSYPGLIRNGTSVANGYSNTIVKNIGVLANLSSSLSQYGGWIGQAYWAKNTSGCIINTCYSTGNISSFNGGICGSDAYGTITKCYSTGTINLFSAGICPDNCNCSISNCFSTGTINTYSGGICGTGTSSCSISYCYTTGAISGSYSGGICRGDTYLINMPFTVSNCYTNGNISSLWSGGICGSYVKGLNIINCYTTGNISGVNCGGVCGYKCSLMTISNCYTVGILTGTGSGKLVPSATSVTPVNSGSSTVEGTWDDTSATLYLTGTPTQSNPVGSVWINTNTSTTNDYWLFSTFGNSPYGSTNSNTFSQTILQGGKTSPALNPLGHNFSIVSINSQPPSNYNGLITIVQSDPVLGGQITVSPSAPVQLYSIKILQQSDYTITNFDLQVNAFCYLETTKILCLIDSTEKWICIKDIQIGTFVKTYLHGYKQVLKKGIIKLQNTPNNSIHKLYKLDKSLISFYPNIFDDLFVSGQHSILVDNLSQTQINKTLSKWKYLQKIDDKFLLMSWVNEHFQQVNDNNLYTLYQLVLECENPKTQYGIYANGILSETMSPYTFQKKKVISA